MHLSITEKETFYRLLAGLQFHAAGELGISVKATSPKEFIDLSIEAKLPVRDAVYDHPELITGYAEKNPNGFDDDELAIVRSWTRFVRGRFIIERHLKKHSIWILDDAVYGVHGISDPLEEMVPKYAIPLMVEAVLLPFHGRIIFDGVFRPHRISFGGGIKRSLKEIYMRAKQNDQIIESLKSPEEKMAQSTETRIPWAPTRNWSKQLAAMEKAVANLRGEKHAVNKEAIKVLGASSELAKTALENADGADLYELGYELEKVIKACNRLQRAIERSEWS